MTQPAHAIDTVLRMALACWCVDSTNGMTAEQHTWLTGRLGDRTPLTSRERERTSASLTWCTRRGESVWRRGGAPVCRGGGIGTAGVSP
jgi:hypothetical protein